MRNQFDRQLQQMQQLLIEMGALCEEAISLSVKALLTRDHALLARIYAADHEIDQKEKEIETMCLRLLLQQQPVARDLRAISAALKMISDMERIGDQARDIGELVELMPAGDLDSFPLADMARAAVSMVTDSIDSFIRQDIDLAQAVMQADDRVDALFVQVRDALVEALRQDTVDSAMAIDLLMISKYLERIGDHAVNIAEWVEFSITGAHPNSELQA